MVQQLTLDIDGSTVHEYSFGDLVDYKGQPLSNRSNTPGNPQKILLGTGLSVWSGQIQEEYLDDFRPWSKAVRVLREMEDDAIIGALYEAIRTPLLDAQFTIKPAGNSSKDIAAAEFLQQNTIDAYAFDWLEHVDDMLEFLPYGWAIAEKVMKKMPNGEMWLHDLTPIGQETLYRWGQPGPDGRVTHFQQTVTTEPYRPSIRTAPMTKLIHMSFRPRKRNPMGRSLSRSVYRPWYFKRNLEAMEAIGAERDIGNVPVVELGEGVFTTADMDSLKSALRNLRVDETMYLIVPNGAKVSAFGAGGKVYNLREIIRDYGHIIRQRFFVDFIALGAEQVGTQALAKEISGFFSLALGSIQQYMLRSWNRQLVPYLLYFNLEKFDGISGFPQIQWAKPGKLNVQSLAQAVSTLLASEAIHWNPELETHLRQAFELPPIDEKEAQAEKDKIEKMGQLTQNGEPLNGQSPSTGKPDGNNSQPKAKPKPTGAYRPKRGSPGDKPTKSPVESG